MQLVETMRDQNIEVKTFSLDKSELKILGQYFGTKFSSKAHLGVMYYDGEMLNTLQVNDKFTYDLPYEDACGLLNINRLVA